MKTGLFPGKAGIMSRLSVLQSVHDSGRHGNAPAGTVRLDNRPRPPAKTLPAAEKKMNRGADIRQTHGRR